MIGKMQVLKEDPRGSMSKLPGVEQYEIVYPRKLHTVHKRDVERNKETKYDDTMEYGIKANGEEVILHLQKNKYLLAKDYTETVYSDDGRQITTSPQIKDHCYYEGYIQNDADSIASISTCKGLSGYFETRGQKYLIEPLGTSDRDEHAVYKYEKLEQKSIKTCGLINNTWEEDSNDPINDIFKSSNSPEMQAYLKAKKYLEVYIVADNTLYKKYEKDVKTVRQRIFGIVNYINTDHNRNEIAVAATMAHEMGHNLGMSHDTSACTCSAKVCIMTDTVSSIIPKKFSSCSLQSFEKYMLSDMPKCLTNVPDISSIIAPPSCGNGFVEKGEECDCGTPEYKKSGAVCRAVKHDCDLAEMCTGFSAKCPADRFRVNGHPCNYGEGYCYMGNCPTRENQCKAAFGPRMTVPCQAHGLRHSQESYMRSGTSHVQILQ
ncbi:disintegrin and metalloproteinase domain-containing protein 28 [Grus japonensis]|uniref:Disintegrin and metalloproteinase domain-containing protein 28 n=1 Tax=Grus japonensis TaxID=30415 RepID=A0ABC9XR57_GRUJA